MWAIFKHFGFWIFGVLFRLRNFPVLGLTAEGDKADAKGRKPFCVLWLTTAAFTLHSSSEQREKKMDRITFCSLSILTAGLFLSSAPSSTGAGAVNCPKKMVFYGGNCYKLFAYQVGWIEAEKFCQDYVPGAHLASIHSFVELIETTNYILDYHNHFEDVWIGLYRVGKHSNSTPLEMMNWVWSDGSTSQYRYWDEGEPNNANSEMNCVELLHEAGYLYWNDEDCEVKQRFICQYKIKKVNMEFLKAVQLESEV